MQKLDHFILPLLSKNRPLRVALYMQTAYLLKPRQVMITGYTEIRDNTLWPLSQKFSLCKVTTKQYQPQYRWKEMSLFLWLEIQHKKKLYTHCSVWAAQSSPTPWGAGSNQKKMEFIGIGIHSKALHAHSERHVHTYIHFVVVVTTHNVFITNHKHTNYDYTSQACTRVQCHFVFVRKWRALSSMSQRFRIRIRLLRSIL